jgi:hypothetical protein
VERVRNRAEGEGERERERGGERRRKTLDDDNRLSFFLFRMIGNVDNLAVRENVGERERDRER